MNQSTVTEVLGWRPMTDAPTPGQRVLFAFRCPHCSEVHVRDTTWTILAGFGASAGSVHEPLGWTAYLGPVAAATTELA